MATSVILKRSARLNYRDTSVKTTPVRKLRPRKTSVTDKDSQTADANVKNIRSYVETKNISTKRHASNKTNTEPTKIIKSETSNKGKKKTNQTASCMRLSKIMELEKPEKFDKVKKKTYKDTSLTEPNKMTKLKKLKNSDKDKKKTYKDTSLTESNKMTKLEKLKNSDKDKKKTYKDTSLTESNKMTKLEKLKNSDKDKKKTYKNITEPDKIMKQKKSVKDKKKTPINKKSNVISNTLSKDRQRKFTKKEEIHTNNTRSRRQMTLKQSFLRQTEANASTSHSHQDKQEDNGNVKLVHQHLAPQRWNSVVVLQDLIDKKVPVYKTAEAFEESTLNKNDIYDFKFDANDTKERLTGKKRKRNINKTKGKIIKRTVQKRAIRKKAAVQSKTPKNEECDTNSKIVQNNPSFVPVITPPPLVTESDKEDISEETEKPDQTVKETAVIDKISAEKIKKHDITKPRIISIENADNLVITKSFNNSTDSQPFRPANIPDNKKIIGYHKIANCSLLTKSLSPIWKTVDTFDPGSPWRPPAYPILSYPKHFAQSTPNMGKIENTYKKNIIHAKDNFHNCEKIINVSDTRLKNIESSIQSTDKISHMKKSSNLQTRKFGTEITNIENFSNSSTAKSNVETIEEKPTLQTEIKSMLDIQPVTTVTEVLNCSSVDNIADKENATSNYQTPKLLKRKKLKKLHLSNFRQSKTSRTKSNTQKENADPQPGPSGIKSTNKKKILSELDLNKPENIRIKMEYNIIDDAHLTPINNNEIKRIAKPTTDLENNFGFSDKESDSDMSLENKFPNNPVQVKAQSAHIKKFTARPARLSLRVIKGCLKKDNHTNKKQTIDQSNIEDSKPLVQKDKNIVDVINFSDTFDVLSESERLSNCETEIPLFMELEPSRFLKPPQHSYKRKRAVAFAPVENSEEEEEQEDQVIKAHSKRKRITKLEKENQKRLDEWIKNVNSTFEEIDNYDLLVE